MEDGEEEEETMVPKRKTEREIELEEGDDYIIDPDIMEKLEKLEAEEEARERSGFYESEESEVDEAYEEIKDLATKIRRKKGEMKADQWIDQTKKSTLTRVSA